MGYGAVKYADLKNHRLTNYKFGFDQVSEQEAGGGSPGVSPARVLTH